MTAVALLSALLAAAFVILAGWTIAAWRRAHTRATALLAAAFTSLAVAIVLDRAHHYTPLELGWPWLVRSLNVVLAVFPWLLAASVWALEGRRPRWSAVGIFGVPVVAAWLAVAPITGPPASPLEELAFLVLFGSVWTTAAVGTAVLLRRAARRFGLARPRMRLMAAGIVTLNAALLLGLVTTAAGSEHASLAKNTVAVAAATTFLLGAVAPPSMRAWWQRGAVASFQQTQAGLAAAVTRADVASAVTPHLARMLGSTALLVDDLGQVLGRSGDAQLDTEALGQQLAAGAVSGGAVRATSVGPGWLVVVAGPYTPVFGRDERDLLDAFALQVRIALERAQLFESVSTQQQDVEAMLLGLAHDIRSPTTAIAELAELQADEPDRSARIELAGHILESTSYLQRLVDAMLELGRIGTGTSDRQPVELLEMATRVTALQQAANPRFTVSAEGSPATVEMDPVRAEQLLDNLVGNAAKHGGRVDLSIVVQVRPRGDETVEVIVADDGAGIPAADRHRVFAPFQRGSNAGGSGSGLGLGLVRRIVEDQGGRLSLEPSGRGARFVVRLPVAPLLRQRDGGREAQDTEHTVEAP